MRRAGCCRLPPSPQDLPQGQPRVPHSRMGVGRAEGGTRVPALLKCQFASRTLLLFKSQALSPFLPSERLEPGLGIHQA